MAVLAVRLGRWILPIILVTLGGLKFADLTASTIMTPVIMASVAVVEIALGVLLMAGVAVRLILMVVMGLAFSGVVLAFALPWTARCGCAGPLALSSREHCLLSASVGLMASVEFVWRKRSHAC